MIGMNRLAGNSSGTYAMTTTSDKPVVPDETETEPIVRTDPVPREQNRVKRQPPYAVVLHNDDINGMDYVVGVLRKVFNFGRSKAVWLMLKAHVTGRCVVWSGSLEVAELKADQLRSCGPDPSMKDCGAPPLGVSVEPLPG
jgi:ATP-dependent Clp protease adaptor protein ClpS